MQTIEIISMVRRSGVLKSESIVVIIYIYTSVLMIGHTEVTW